MKQSFFVPGPLPSMNEIINASSTTLRGGIRFGSKYTILKRRWSEKIQKCAEEQGVERIEGPYTADLVWTEETRRKDPDNIAAGVKFIFDALVTNGSIGGDGWNYNKGWSNSFLVGDSPGVNVTITSYTEKKNHQTSK